MSMSSECLIPWRERAFLSRAEVAVIFGRSTTWVGNRLADGSLTAARIPAGGSVGVTVASVVALVDSAQPVTAENVPAPARARGHLRVASIDGRAVALDHP